MKKIPVSEILSLPRSHGGESSLSLPEWLQMSLSRLSRPRHHPVVLRHTKVLESPENILARVEVRRRTQGAYSAIPMLGASDFHLFFDPEAHLVECTWKRRRVLRQSDDLVVYDDIYAYQAVRRPQLEHLRALQGACITACLKELYQLWAGLDQQQKERLVSYPASWDDVRPALEPHGRLLADGPQAQVEAFVLLLSEQAHPELRQQILAAGARGELKPVPAVLPQLLAQPHWNQSPALVAMAHSAAQCPVEQLVALQEHPNPVVRARLVELLPSDHDWIGWLATESDKLVREAIRRAVERQLNPNQLVDRLIGKARFWTSQPADPRRAEALGWLLVGWSKKLEHSQDWSALNRAVLGPIGAENRRKLRQKLLASRRLSLAARLLG